MGCRVVTVESTRRPDGGRLARRFFEALHGRTESLALDLSQVEGRTLLRRVLQRADVVIEGSRPRALEQMGILAEELLDQGPRLWVSITAHGRVGAGASRVGFGDDAAAAGGLVGWVDGHPRFVADAVADPLTGLTAAHSIATLIERGGRWLVDVALSRVARSAVGGGIEPIDGLPVVRRQPRRDVGGRLPLGRDTQRILTSLGVV
jgi:crotonobetainyl-CoA:carnitine CoA-transferase CaiB-like acyl-CoA transferase